MADEHEGELVIKREHATFRIEPHPSGGWRLWRESGGKTEQHGWSVRRDDLIRRARMDEPRSPGERPSGATPEPGDPDR